tara:strand:+ start:53211 stop:53531 length:321 start_codon:yes stop_codon:yes gene_type:complete
MEIGGVGSAGMGGSGVNPAAPAQAPTADNGAPTNVQPDVSEAGHEAASCCGGHSSAVASVNFSSQDFLQLHQTVRGASAPEGTNFDMQKLLELIMAMKLLEQMDRG